MERQPVILVVDDVPANIELLEAMLEPHGYNVVPAASGTQALAAVAAAPPDLILLDVVMPGMDGYEVCRRVRADSATSFLPVVIVTASDNREKVRALEAGADDFVAKPFANAELLARIKSLLRIKSYHDTIRTQADELANWSRTLEARVHDQVIELERLARLRRFLAPQIADVIIAAGDEHLLESHRQEITVVCCQLRGFDAFSETAEPEEALAVVREFHTAVGAVVFEFEGTLEHFAGDRLTVIFNDPYPCSDPSLRAVQMALDMCHETRERSRAWAARGYDLDLAVGIAMGYATLGRIGFEGRFEYGAIGPVTTLASRLCDSADSGQILVGQRVQAAVHQLIETEPAGDLLTPGTVKPSPMFKVHGKRRPTTATNVTSLPLSPREQEVAALISRGLTNRHIAEHLVVSERTVATHIEHILAKLAFTSRVQVGLWAAEHGLVRPD